MKSPTGGLTRNPDGRASLSKLTAFIGTFAGLLTLTVGTAAAIYGLLTGVDWLIDRGLQIAGTGGGVVGGGHAVRQLSNFNRNRYIAATRPHVPMDGD